MKLVKKKFLNSMFHEDAFVQKEEIGEKKIIIQFKIVISNDLYLFFILLLCFFRQEEKKDN